MEDETKEGTTTESEAKAAGGGAGPAGVDLFELIRGRRTRGMTLSQVVAHLASRDLRDRGLLRHEARRELRRLEEAGRIVLGRGKRFFALEFTELRTGRLQMDRRGSGIVMPEAGNEPAVAVPRSGLRGGLDGDLVVVRLDARRKTARREDLRQGSVVRVLERRRRTVVGRWILGPGEAHVRPLERDLPIPIFPTGSRVSGEPRDGEFVVVALDRPAGRKDRTQGTIVEHLGVLGEPGVENRVVLRMLEIPVEFPPEALAEADRLAGTISAEDLAGRWDLRDRPAITIDGRTAKDFDDAVNAAPGRGDEIVVEVHIADVGHYVRPGSALDRAARERGTSVYLPGLCVPMLPERLSNDLCSLKEDVDRLTLTVRFWVSGRGEIKRWEIHDSVIRSRRRCTYSEAFTWLERPATSWPDLTKPFAESLRLLAEVADRLGGRRRRKGSLDFDLLEPEVLLDPEGRVVDILPFERNRAHRMIEELMVAANECVARTLMAAGSETLYRVHEGPSPDKIEALREVLSELGIELGETDGVVRPKDLQRVLAEIAGTEWERFLSALVLRSLARAEYSAEPRGHYALATDSYVHFTSPIRRYPDLVVHRGLRELGWGEAGAAPGRRAAPTASIQRLAAAATDAQRRAEDAERRVLHWKKVLFMRGRVGEEFAAHITGVTRFGVFAQLDQLLVEGLIHISDLVDDYYHFDESRHVLTGERTGRTWRLGDSLKVRVVRVDLDQMRIDFTPVGLKADPAAVRRAVRGRRRRHRLQ